VFDLNELELERSGEAPVTPPPRRSPNYALWTMAIVAAIAAGGGVWYFTSTRQPLSPARVNVPAAPQATVPERPEVPLVHAADIDLPPLPQTDPIVRELVARLSSHPTIAAWLATKGLIANFTVSTLAIAEGRTPAQFLRPIAPRGRFRTRSSGEELFVDPRSYDRYNPHADAIAALDSVGTASLYLTLKPRISDAYAELGYPEGDFDRVLERAIGVLLQTPALDEKVALDPKGVTYAYSDPTLESLSPAQKQLLRMGPRNSQAIRAKLEEIAALLQLHPQPLRR
jgi:Protein of unknown function (DUF3014)